VGGHQERHREERIKKEGATNVYLAIETDN
jgi:hypothetical protein